MNIGKAVITTGITIGKFLMIKAHEVKNGGMKVVNMNSIFDCGEPKFIGCTVTEIPFVLIINHWSCNAVLTSCGYAAENGDAIGYDVFCEVGGRTACNKISYR